MSSPTTKFGVPRIGFESDRKVAPRTVPAFKAYVVPQPFMDNLAKAQSYRQQYPSLNVDKNRILNELIDYATITCNRRALDTKAPDAS